jgi:hypothetical protein
MQIITDSPPEEADAQQEYGNDNHSPIEKRQEQVSTVIVHLLLFLC